MAKVRKQIYIEPYQERQLKRLSKKEGVSEAAIIRQAIARHLEEQRADSERRKAWQEARAFAEHLMAKGAVGRWATRPDLDTRRPL